MTGPCQLDPAQMEGALHRMAGEVAARLGSENLVLLGIRSRGLPLAERLAVLLSEATQRTAPMGALDITLYRDDLTEKAGAPIVRPTEIPFTLKERTVVLVDDVLFTGRTIRAAMDALVDFGRPRSIQLAVLVDRGHRELPIKADYVGKNLPTAPDEQVHVRLAEADGVDEVVIEGT